MERYGRCRAGVVDWAARRRAEVSTQMCSEAGNAEPLGGCELRDAMYKICGQAPGVPGLWAAARRAGVLAGERCGGAGGLATSRPGGGGGRRTARRGEKNTQMGKEKRGGSEKRDESSCTAVAGVMHG